MISYVRPAWATWGDLVKTKQNEYQPPLKEKHSELLVPGLSVE
jgi:hypothetical protein